MIKAKENNSKFYAERHEPLKTFIMHSISWLCITLDILYSGDFVTFWITILNGSFFFICNSKIIKIGLYACTNYGKWKNEYHNNQGTIVIHSKRWLFYIIANLCCYNKLKIPCLGILLQNKTIIFVHHQFFYILLRQVVTMNAPFTFYDKYWTKIF